jgi:pimeloyl-ACP methyl ester carboxylesterase
MLNFNIYPCKESSTWVTFIHGAGGSSTIWYKQIRDFQKDFNVLLLDLRGHGASKSVLNSKLYTFQSIGNDVIEVLDHLNIHKTHFVGISLGTIIIRDLSERFPTRVSSMILGGAVMKLNLKSQILMHTGNLLKSVLPYLLLYRLFAFVIMPKKAHRESRNLFINEAKKVYQKEFKRWFKLVSQVNPLLTFFRIKESNISTLYVMGEEDYLFLPAITKLMKEHKNAYLQIIPNCGHVVNIDKPKEFNLFSIQFILENELRFI